MYYIKDNKILYICIIKITKSCIYVLYKRKQNPVYMYYIEDNKILYICII